jgi:hypothetical protein
LKGPAVTVGPVPDRKETFVKTALTAAGLGAVVLLVTASVGAAPAKPFKVASTLDGKSVLPQRIRWLGLPALTPAKTKEVDFLIDGRVAWVEHQPPYVYSDDEGPHRGYLVTSFLSAGRHRFTVKAISTDGATATDTVVARVLPPPVIPATLAGTWQRTLASTSGAPRHGANNPTDTGTPPGRYTITFERRWIHDVFPCDTSPCRFNANTGGGGEFVSDWTPGAKTFQVRGPITFRVLHDSDRLGGWWCWMDGPSATYTWSVSGDTLTLAPVGGRDACGIRGFIWAGDWTRVG